MDTTSPPRNWRCSRRRAHPVGLGDEQRELEAEVHKMAPPNCHSVLISHGPCGCPKGRMMV